MEKKTIPKIERDLRNAINANVAALMAVRGYDRERVAAALGISRSALDNRLRGDVAWTSDDIAEIARLAKVAPEQILKTAF